MVFVSHRLKECSGYHWPHNEALKLTPKRFLYWNIFVTYRSAARDAAAQLGFALDRRRCRGWLANLRMAVLTKGTHSA
jgi:hypothetical protein